MRSHKSWLFAEEEGSNGPIMTYETLVYLSSPLVRAGAAGDEVATNLQASDSIVDCHQLAEAHLDQYFLSLALRTVLATLSSRQGEVLALRYGLLDGQSRTLEEVGCYFGVHRERIRQIENKALRALRHPIRSNKLRDFRTDPNNQRLVANFEA